MKRLSPSGKDTEVEHLSQSHVTLSLSTCHSLTYVPSHQIYVAHLRHGLPLADDTDKVYDDDLSAEDEALSGDRAFLDVTNPMAVLSHGPQGTALKHNQNRSRLCCDTDPAPFIAGAINWGFPRLLVMRSIYLSQVKRPLA